jgi:hypothetical protein
MCVQKKWVSSVNILCVITNLVFPYQKFEIEMILETRNDSAI